MKSNQPKHTKVRYLELVNELSERELEKEIKDLEMQKMKANIQRSKGANPYHNSEYDTKVLKWKLTICKIKLAGVRTK